MDDLARRVLTLVKRSEIRDRLTSIATDYLLWSGLLALTEEAEDLVSKQPGNHAEALQLCDDPKPLAKVEG